MRRILLDYWWIVLWCFLALTNTHISPDDSLTTVSAMDTSIYLNIANSAPHLPASGANLVFHGAQRFFYPYILGLLAKSLGISSWSIFQIAVHFFTFLTAWVFWKIATVVTKGNFQSAVLLTSIMICNPFAFRLQLAFSGFVNDVIFNFGLALLTWSLIGGPISFRWLGLLVMIPAKQTIFLIIPALLLAELFFSSRNRGEVIRFWLGVAVATVIYYSCIDRIIAPFSTANTTAAMAFGFLYWLESAHSFAAVAQFSEFLGRGILGLFAPLIACVAIIRRGRFKELAGTRQQTVLALLFLSTIAQPLISGPAITDASIQRLLSLGLIPMLALLGVSLKELNWRSNLVLPFAVIACAVGATHHLFSFLGPDLTRRYYFLMLYISSSVVMGVLLWVGLDRNSISHGEE